MKRITLSLLGLALLLLAGCVVTSIYPYYTTKDLTFDPALVGTWSDSGQTNADKEMWTFEGVETKAYKLTIRDAAKTNVFDTHLFTLGHTRFLDVLPTERYEYATPAHLLLRVTSLQPQLEMHILNYDWLAKLLDTNPKAIRHILVPNRNGAADGGQFTLTADTVELQKFIKKHINNTNAWGEPMVLKKP